MKTLNDIVAEQIRTRREAMGLTRTQLGQRFGDKTGKNVGFWEKGRSLPSAYSLCDLADVFECSVDELLGRK